jgi:hypothetical protein
MILHQPEPGRIKQKRAPGGALLLPLPSPARRRGVRVGLRSRGSSMRGVFNDAVSIYFLDATFADVFVADGGRRLQARDRLTAGADPRRYGLRLIKPR